MSLEKVSEVLAEVLVKQGAFKPKALRLARLVVTYVETSVSNDDFHRCYTENRLAKALQSAGISPAKSHQLAHRLVLEILRQMALPTYSAPSDGGPLQLEIGFTQASQTRLETDGTFGVVVEADRDTDRSIELSVGVQAGNTLIEGEDFEFVGPPTVFIGENQRQGLMRIRFLADDVDDGVKQAVFVLSTSDASATLTQATHTLNMQDVPPSPLIEFAVDEASLSQGDGNMTSVPLVVSNPHPFAVMVMVRQSAGDLTPTGDYLFTEEITIPANGTSAQLNLSTIDGGAAGTATLELYNPSSGAIGPNGTLTLTVTETSELPFVRWRVESREAAIQEAGDPVVLTWEAVGAIPTPFGYAITAQPGSSADPADYSLDITLGNQPGQISDANRTGTVTVTALGDAVLDDGEVLILQVSGSPTFSQFEPGTRNSFITIGDTPPGVDPAIPEVRCGSPATQNILQNSTATFDAVRDLGYPGETVRVTVAPSAASTAVEGTDYTLSSTSILLGPSDLTGSLTVTSLTSGSSRTLELEIVAHERVTSGTANGLIGLPRSSSFAFGQVNPSFTTEEIEIDEGGAGGTLRVQIEGALTNDYEVTLVTGEGSDNSSLVVASSVTIPAGQTFVDVPVSSPAVAAPAGQRGRYVEIPGASAGFTKCLVIINDVRVPETPQFEMLRHYAFSAVGTPQWGAVKCTNFGLADFTSSVTVDLIPSGCTLDTASLVFDGTKEVMVFKATPTSTNFLVNATGAGVDPQPFVGMDGSLDGKQAEIKVPSIPGHSGDQMVRFVVPALAPTALAQAFNIGGTSLDVHEKLWDHETGHPSHWLCAGLVPSASIGSGSVPNTTTSLRVIGGSGAASSATLQELDLSALEIQCTTAQGTVFTSRPFSPGHPTIRSTDVRRDGTAFKETVVTVELTNGTDACTSFRVTRQTRSDMRCETLSFHQVHGKRDKTEPAASQATVGYGALYFDKIEVVGLTPSQNGVVSVARLAQAAGVGNGNPIANADQFYFDDGANKFVLTDSISEQGANARQHMPTGHMNVRRVAVYEPATVEEQTAQFVCDGKDMGMLARGDFGWHKGGWAGYQPMPDFWADDMPNMGNSASKDQSLEGVAQVKLNSFLGEILLNAIPNTNFRFGGYLKGTASGDAREPGQGFMNMHGFPFPSPTGALLSRTISDQWIERHGGAMLDTVSWGPMTLADVCHETGGAEIPVPFSANYFPDEHRHPHCLDPSVLGVTKSQHLAVTGKPWNSLEPGQTAPYMFVTEYVGRNPLGQQFAGMQMCSHMSRYLSSWIGPHYMLDDAPAEFAIRADATLKACTGTHLPVKATGLPASVINRISTTSAGDQYYKDIIDRGKLDAFSKNKGFYGKAEPVSGPTSYTLPHSSRQFAHPVAAVMYGLATYPHTAPEVAIYDTYDDVVAQVWEHSASGTGNLHSSGPFGEGARYATQEPSVYDSLSGSVPYPFHDNVPGQWLPIEEIHSVYLNWAVLQVDARRRSKADYHFDLARVMERAAIIEEGLTAKVGQQFTPCESFGPSLPGMKLLSNPVVLETEAKRGVGAWRGGVPPVYPFGSNGRISNWVAGAFVLRRWTGLGRIDGMVKYLERTNGQQAGKTVDQVLTDQADAIANQAYRNRFDYWLQSLGVLGVLQLSKTLPS